LNPQGVRGSAEGLEEVLVVEEKRSVIESQLKEQLYNWPADKRPRIIGKYDEEGRWILPSPGELTPTQIAKAIGDRLTRLGAGAVVAERLAAIEAREKQQSGSVVPFARTPYFCSGCPHNTSTRVPEGSRALAGLGWPSLSHAL